MHFHTQRECVHACVCFVSILLRLSCECLLFAQVLRQKKKYEETQTLFLFSFFFFVSYAKANKTKTNTTNVLAIFPYNLMPSMLLLLLETVETDSVLFDQTFRHCRKCQQQHQTNSFAIFLQRQRYEDIFTFSFYLP